jgi:hypothetical protein
MTLSKERRTSKFGIMYCIFCLFILSPYAVKAELYINKVLYDPVLSETGGEAVELYNSGNDAVDISGYTIKTASSEEAAVLPSNAMIPANGHYLIADAGWSTKKDSILYPLADYEKAITLTNTNGGVALLDREKNMIDAVGWGNIADEQLYRGTPANTIKKEGEAIIRVNYTNNNSRDFISGIPDFINSKEEDRDMQNNAIQLNVNVQDIRDYIQNITLDYDIEDKVILNPGRERELSVSFFVYGETDDAELYVKLNQSRYDVSEVGNHGSYKKYNSIILLDYYTRPGNYTADIVMNKSGILTIKNISFEVMPLLAFDIDLKEVNCSVAYTRTCLIEGDSDMSTKDRPTIKNIGNKGLDFKIYAANLTNNKDSIGVSNVKFSFHGDTPDIELGLEPTIYNVALLPGNDSVLALSLLIDVPIDTASGSYTSQLFLLGVGNG